MTYLSNRTPADRLVSSPALHAFLGVAALWLLTSLVTIGYSVCYSYCRKAKMLITRSTLNLIALVGMLITAFLATALEVRDMNRNSPSLETSNSSDR